MHNLDSLISLLCALIRTPSFSREEEMTRKLLDIFLRDHGIACKTIGNNVWVQNKYFDAAKPTLLLNSHHDTVKPNTGYTRDPFEAALEDNKVYGLGANDAGGSLVCLLGTFLHYYSRKDLPFNIIFAASAEEEISGKNGVELLLKHMPAIDFGIVGEPTSGEAAVSEKGLLVLDCTAHGTSGHAARNEGSNAIYTAMKDIAWFQDYSFANESSLLGPIHMNVTIIQAGSQHNVIPNRCTYTVDVRTTDAYSLEETLEIIQKNINAEAVPRSVRLRPSHLPHNHPLYQAITAHGIKTYGSPTLSDQALMPFPTVKIGPGDSARSHTADEFIFKDQLASGLEIYKKIIQTLLVNYK